MDMSGKESDGYDQVHRGCGFGTRNEEGQAILEFGVATDMIVCNTVFRKRKNHLVTYTSGGAKTQLDYMLVRRANRRKVTNVKAIPGLECVQQHSLIVADLNLWMIRKHKKKFVPKLKLRKLKDEDSRADFRRKVLERANTIEEANRPEVRESWTKSSEEVCGWTKGGKRHKETWW